MFLTQAFQPTVKIVSQNICYYLHGESTTLSNIIDWAFLLK